MSAVDCGGACGAAVARALDRWRGSHPGPDTPLLSAFAGMSMDERWLLPPAEEMFRTFPWFAGERFDAITDDLRAQPAKPLTIAEGFRLLPRLVARHIDDARRAVWLLSTPDFSRRVFEARESSVQFWRRTSDPERALARLLERDALFTRRVRQEAGRLGLRVIEVDGRTDSTALVDEVADWFRL
ncbi:MAG TPA: hypothetical protein VFH54_04800 [Mycobacteriales bacterium]|nr:hypothetical protein [Mycobacteriales bacterium]